MTFDSMVGADPCIRRTSTLRMNTIPSSSTHVFMSAIVNPRFLMSKVSVRARSAPASVSADKVGHDPAPIRRTDQSTRRPQPRSANTLLTEVLSSGVLRVVIQRAVLCAGVLTAITWSWLEHCSRNPFAGM